MRPAPTHPNTSRRGVTLVEMLVAVALLVLMMSVLVLIFQSATGAIQEQRAYAALDQDLRRLYAVIRQDLRGVTAKMTPPNNPNDGTGYFEYSEGALADAQGEDSDDTLRFTVKAPEGHPFIGRIWLPYSLPAGTGQTLVPTPGTSEFAEVIDFLRNQKLYRRVLLIAPERVGQLGLGNTPFDSSNPPGTAPSVIGFRTSIFAPYGAFAPYTYAYLAGTPFVGWQGFNDISARPSKFNVLPGLMGYSPTPNTLADLTNRENRAFTPRFANDYVTNATGATVPDGLPDDSNNDGVPDYYPVMYPGILSPANPYLSTGSLLFEPTPATRNLWSYDVVPFPFLYPGSYSQVDPFTAAYGAIHSLDPSINPTGTATRPYFGTFLDPPYNHNPLDIGDNLPPPNTPQTWWGFPTWRETMSANWLDPIKRINDPAGTNYFGALPPGGIAGQEAPYTQTPALSRVNPALLPPQLNQPYNDTLGSPYFYMPPEAVWEDDLILSNVRSFDVKAFDPNPLMLNPATGLPTNLPAGYYDLGYANLVTGTPSIFLGSFAHEGRIPPLVNDFRADAQFPALLPNIGDNNTGVVRLRRVWDSWSTEYSIAPALPLIPYNGPLAGNPPVMPSYPAPYPAPLRGIQIQIRVVDPSNQRVKTLTIRQDFSDKL